MKLTPLELEGAHLLDLEPRHDERGFFARAFCAHELAQQRLNADLPQINVSFNHKAGTLRGMHFQRQPHAETKIVRCTSGAIYDVIVDLRTESATFKRWFGTELSAENRRSLYVPSGFAHGFLTLSDGAEVLYLMGAEYVPDAAAGVRYDDPTFGIRWPAPIRVISERDRNYPRWNT